MEKRNALISSISGKIPLLQAVASAAQRLDPQSGIIGADMDEHCLGRYFVPCFWPYPRLEELSDAELVDYCHNHSVFAVIPTRDGELLYWSHRRPLLAAHGVSVMASTPSVLEICLDKSLFFRTCRSLALPVIPTYDSVENLSSGWVTVKERVGAGSRGTVVRVRREDALQAARFLRHPIFQPFLEGKEYSLDLYVSRQGRVMGSTARTRDRVVSGESQVTTTVPCAELEELGARLAKAIGLYGHAVLQAIQDDAGRFHLLECNARFGGASTLSLAAGLDSFYWFLREAEGNSIEEIPFNQSARLLRQVRHPADWVYEVKDDPGLRSG